MTGGTRPGAASRADRSLPPVFGQSRRSAENRGPLLFAARNRSLLQRLSGKPLQEITSTVLQAS